MPIFSEELQWFSQQTFFYQDVTYQSGSSLRLSISTNTTNFQSFNSPVFSLSISDNIKRNRSCILHIQTATDLYQSLKSLFENPALFNAENPPQITKKYKDNSLILFFIKDRNRNENIVKIQIFISESDQCYILMNLETFKVLLFRLKYFVENYDEICMNFKNGFILSELLRINNAISNEIKTLPTFIQQDQSPREEDLSSHNIYSEFDKFSGGKTLENISSEEIDEFNKKLEEPSKVSTKSFFIERLLKGNLSTFESMLRHAALGNSVELLENEFRKFVPIPLPDIDENSYKSLCYIPKFIETYYLNKYTYFSKQVPDIPTVFKYKPENISSENLELAYDLLTCYIYMKSLKGKASEKILDSLSNKSEVLLYFQTFCSPFIFSFFGDINDEQLASIIISRYKTFDSIGFFKDYKEFLTEYSISDITEKDILNTLKTIRWKEFDVIKNIHQMMFEKDRVKIPAENSFSLEQIINQIIICEVCQELQIPNETVNFILDENPDIRQLFEEKKVIEEIIKPPKKSPILRYMKNHLDSIKEEYRDKFKDYLDGIQDKNFVLDEFQKTEIPIEDLPEAVLKGLYSWKPEDNSALRLNYKVFEDEVSICPEKKMMLVTLFGQEKIEGDYNYNYERIGELV